MKITPSEPRNESIEWFDFKEDVPNSKEIRFFALLVISKRPSVAHMNEWVCSVLRYEAYFESRGKAGLPPDWLPSMKVQVPPIYEYLYHAYAGVEWDTPMLQRIANAMHTMLGDGQQVNLTPQHLRDHYSRQKAHKSKKPKALLHWKTPAALFGVARLIKDRRSEMEQSLNIEISQPKPTLMESIVINRVMQVDLEESERKAKLAKDAARQAAARLTAEKNARKADAAAAKKATKSVAMVKKEALRELRAKAKTKYLQRKAEVRKELKPGLVKAARHQVDGQLKHSNTLRNQAHALKRDAIDALHQEREISEKRLRRAEDAEEKLRTARDQLAEFSEHYGAALTAKRKYEALGKQLQLMPTWRPVQIGRGQKQFEFSYRLSIYAQYENGTPRSAIGENIVATVRRTAPWLNPVKPSLRVLSDCRFEMRTIDEALSGREVAEAYRVRQLGSDESTKFGNAAITSNVIIEKTPGAELKVVVMRGVYCSAGGTAEAVATAINTKCFARLRDLQRRWRKQFEIMYPGVPFTGPDPSRCCLGRLGGGGALIADTCNTAQKIQTLLAAMIAKEVEEEMGADAWASMSEAERAHACRVHKLSCWQHMRNIFLNKMSSAQATHVEEELKPWLDAFSSWDRMTTNFTQLLRASYKEFHHGNAYYKGKGREFWVWLKAKYPKVFAIHFERAEGGRQDLDYDAAIALYIMRPYIIEFLHTLVHGADHSNILEDFLYISFRSVEYIAMTRANALIDMLISRPMRWLSGNAYLLDNFSPLDMSVPLNLVHDKFVEAAADGSVLLDPALDLFKPLKDTQPLFAEFCEEMFEKDHVLSPDGTTKHLIFDLVRKELLDPKDPTNVRTRLKTIEYLEVQCKAALEKMTDPKLALKRHLDTPDVLARADTIGLDATNDRLAESLFGCWDYVLRRNPGISLEAASALVHAMRSKTYGQGGRLEQLPEREARALVEMARITVDEMRAIDREDHAELDAYHTAKRRSNSQLELDALVKRYALALSFFDRWSKRGVPTIAEAKKKIAGLSNQEKLDWLREQIEMRVIGLGFEEFKPAWSSSTDENIGTVDDLSDLLRDILMEERDRACARQLPKRAVVPQMRRKNFKELGTPTLQAELLADKVLELPADELWERAVAERARLGEAGEIDEVGDVQEGEAPLRDDSLVGSMLEIRWRYWRPVTDEERAAGDKRKKRAVDMWCEGEVVQVANGKTDKESPSCKKLLEAGAVRMKWPADPTREEKETFTWCILTDGNWNEEAVLGWRFAAAELAKRQEAVQQPAPKRRRARED